MSLRAVLAGAGGGGMKVHATGYVSAATTGTGATSTEDGRFLDITISAVPDVNKVMVTFVGNANAGLQYYGAAYNYGSNEPTRIVLARMTSPTNLRLSLNGASVADKNTITGRYVVYDLS